MRRLGLVAALLSSALLSAREAHAQYPGGGAYGPGGMPATPMGQQGKEEGPAEQAPEDEERATAAAPLTTEAELARRRVQVLEIDGYMRLRTDYLHKFFLGQSYAIYGGELARPPFPVPLDCAVPQSTADITPVEGELSAVAQPCGKKNSGSGNLRLRLEPTINVTDQVRVHSQIDVFDNTIAGSTPDSMVGLYRDQPATDVASAYPGAAPTPFLYGTQNPPEVGQNGFVSSIRAKRAWAEVDSQFGSLRFGRMPWHFGRGIAYNSGNCPDCDYGTTVDRIMVLSELYGHQVAAAWDFAAQGLTGQQIRFGQMDPGGYPIDLSQDDDVFQMMAAITKIDTPQRQRERVQRGELVLSYGLQLVYRSQRNDVVKRDTLPAEAAANLAATGSLDRQDMPTLQPINALMVTPDLWFKLQYKAFTLEFEGVANFGKVDRAGPLAYDENDRLTLRQFGWVVAGQVALYHDTFFVGLETGGASGDQAEDPTQYLNYRWRFVRQPSGDRRITDFKFSPDYHVDEILFRRIMGTVTNAIYVKPQLAYWFDLGSHRQVGLTGAIVMSVAQVPISTPGNSSIYGAELNAGFTYRNTGEGFYAGATWGVLFPLGALDRPADLYTTYTGTGVDASSAQILRTFFGVRF